MIGRDVAVTLAVLALSPAAPWGVAVAQTDALSGAEAAPFHEGLWILHDPECRFDLDKPVSRWPRCAQWGVIQSSAWLQYAPEHWSGLLPPPAEGQAWTRVPFALPPGERRILQLKTDPFGEDGYQFLEVRVERRDPAHRITAFTMGFPAPGRPFAWKPPAPSPAGFDPFPDAEATACASDTTGRCESGEPYLDFTLTWVRDPRPDDFARR